MKLPNAEHAIVEIEKLRDYCLSSDHPKGKHKARVFLAALGISQNDADELRRVILNRVSTAEAIEKESMGTDEDLSLTLRSPGAKNLELELHLSARAG